MNPKIPNLLKCLVVYGLLIQLVSGSLLASSELTAQKGKSVREVYVDVKTPALSIGSVFKWIESKTDFRFTYDKRFVNEKIIDQTPVSLKVKRQSVADVLMQVSKAGDLRFKQINDVISVNQIKKRSPANEVIQIVIDDVEVTGQVTDENGEGLPGASVREKGTTNGAVTDIDGNYKLSVNEGATLVFSFVGYQTQEVALGSQNSLNVQMQPNAKQLEELVVIGYGTQKKTDVTGALSMLDAKEITQQPGFNATQSIQGKAAGVQIVNTAQPGASPKIRIRGIGTVLGGANPIFVVDGVITPSIDNINSNDIKSITVLKDASASAIYGVRGANGVILVTTKSGDVGPLRVNYNSYVGFRQAINVVQMANARLYADYTNQALVRSGAAAQFPDINHVPYTDGQQYNTHWFGAVTRKALLQNHSLSLSGGSEKNTIYFGVNYYKENGILKKNDVERLVFRLNDTYAVNDHIKISAHINYSVSHQNGVVIDGDGTNNTTRQVFTQAYMQAPYVPAIDNKNRYGTSGASNNVGNPVATLDFNHDKYWNNRLQGALSGSVDFLKHFNFKTYLAFDFNLNRARSYTPHYTVDSRQRTDKSTLRIWRNIHSFLNWNNFLKYENEVGDHSFSVLAGFTTEETVISRLTGSRDNIPNQERLWFLDVGDVTSAKNNHSGDKATRLSYVSRVTYAFKNKYLLTGTARLEGSSKFAKAQRYGFFPAIGVGWRLSEEGFLQGVSWLDRLKLRGSWGRIGNDNIPSNQAVVTVGTSQSLGAIFGTSQAFQNGATVNQQKDEAITWETVESYDIGMDFSLFEGKLSGEVDYYNKLTKDLLINKPIGIGSGDDDNRLFTNAGEILNRGVEVLLKYRSTIADKIKYSIGGNVTFNKNRVKKLAAGSQIIGGDLGNGNNATRTVVGSEVGSFWVFKTHGIYSNAAEVQAGPQPQAKPGDLKIVDTNGDGTIDDADKILLGGFTPKAYFGFNISLTYKKIDFSIDTYGNVGNKVFNGLKYRRIKGENVVAPLAGFWTTENTASTIPAPSNAIPAPSDYYVEGGDFFRINNITLGYSFDTPWTSKLKVYLSAQNPVMWQKYSGYTPELPRGVLDSGIELDIYPSVAAYLIGVNINFKAKKQS